jgi:signal transduction histidine kinase
MKSLEPETAPFKGEWIPAQVADAVAPVPGGPAEPRRDSDRTRTFVHQLSQVLTCLRGTLELALLADGDASEYRKVIRQSLAQAEGLVQLLRSFRAPSDRSEQRSCE